MKSKLRELAVRLRVSRKLSYGAILQKVPVSKSTLSYWLREYPLSQEKITELRLIGWKKGEAARERFRATMRSKREAFETQLEQKYLKKFKNLSASTYFVAGLMLYLGEGDKKNRNRIGLANTDPQIISFFIEWLGACFGVSKSVMRAELHLYDNMDIPTVESFWRNTTHFSKQQFYKTQIKKSIKNTFSYQEPNRHGTCSIFLMRTKEKTEVMIAIRAFMKKYASIPSIKRA